MPFCGDSRWQSLHFILEISGVEMSAAWQRACKSVTGGTDAWLPGNDLLPV